MQVMTRRGRILRILGLLVIAVPWLLRDQLASTFEAQSLAAQRVLTGLDAETQRWS